MLHLPIINIVTVCYNAANTIGKTISSISNQTYANINYIIIDGKSTDNTLDIINLNKNKIHTLITEPDEGIYDAMNKSLKYCKSGWVLFIGADDELTSNTIIEEAVSYLQDESIVYYGNSFFIKRGIKYDGYFTKYKLALRNISHQSAFYPVSIFKHFTFNTSYKLLADYDLNIQLFKSKDYGFRYIPLCVTNFNDDASSSNNMDFKFENNKSSLVKYYLGYGPFIYIQLRKLLKKIMFFKK